MHLFSGFKNVIRIGFALFVLAALSCTLLAGCSNDNATNRAILEQLEERSVDDAQTLIYERADEKIRPILQQYGSDGFLEADASRSVFKNSIVIGDSVTYMAFVAGYFTEDEVSAYYSVSLKTCDEYVQKAIDMRPARIVFNFGTNDMVLFGGNADDFAQMYLERCEWIKRELPNVQIFIASTMSPTEETMALNDGMVYADEFNTAVIAMCDKTDRVTYIKTDYLVKQHEDLRAEDGIHFQDDFYGYWCDVVAEAMFQ